MMPLLDEADILLPNLRWYADAGIATVAFDNASTDGTAEMANEAVARGDLTAFQRSEERVEWSYVTGALLMLAEQQQPDMVVVTGADEFLETADGTPLRTAIARDMADGLDVLRIDTMEFCLTDEDHEKAPGDPVARLRRYSPYRTIVRDRGIRWSCGVEWTEPNRLLTTETNPDRSPRRYINRHYPFRSRAQALERIRAGRLPGVLAGSSADGLTALIEDASDLLVPARKLARYEEDHRWTGRAVVGELRLRAVSKLSRRLADRHVNAQRQVNELSARLHELQYRQESLRRDWADLKKRYTHVLLERDRLAAQGLRPSSGALAASADWYDEHYRLTRDKNDAHYSESPYLPVWKEIAGRIESTARVLEIGCGTGQLAQLLADRGVRRYRGFDFSERAIGLARARLPEADFRVADARSTGLLDSEDYDIALCTEVLEHLDDDISLLRRVRPGTRVLATVPSFDSTSHLRYFADEDAVIERYGATLQQLEVLQIPLSASTALFLMTGVASGPVAP